MYEMTVRLNQDKIKAANEPFPYEEMLKAIDEFCDQSGFDKIEEGRYSLREDKSSIAAMMGVIARFKAQSWLFPYLEEWTVDSEEDGHEDVYATFKEVRKKRFRRC